MKEKKAFTRVLVPSGVLGLGFDTNALAQAVAMQPDIICIDGGSTDSGPSSLGTGTSKYSRSVCKSEWRELMQVRAQLGVPLVIGSCGTCGSDSTVDWMLDMTKELAAELGQQVKVAVLYSEQPAQRIQQAFSEGALQALVPAPDITHDSIEACTHIVALAGIEQINEALATGADIVLAGRSTDAGLIAALPIAQGRPAGVCWHGAKIAECGALCSTNPTSGVIIVDFDDNGFEVEALAEGACCTPHSVSAHMLYENVDPFILHEPGGALDVRSAHYSSVNEKRVRVEGSRWIPAEHYTVKLEAARVSGYQTTLFAVIRDTHYVQNAQAWADSLSGFIEQTVKRRMGLTSESFSFEVRLVGMNAVLGALETKSTVPNEVGVLVMITAESAEHAMEIAKLANPFVLHYPLTRDEELPTFAFAYSPAQTERGALYEFCMNHTLRLNNPMDAFALSTVELG